MFIVREDTSGFYCYDVVNCFFLAVSSYKRSYLDVYMMERVVEGFHVSLWKGILI